MSEVLGSHKKHHSHVTNPFGPAGSNARNVSVDPNFEASPPEPTRLLQDKDTKATCALDEQKNQADIKTLLKEAGPGKRSVAGSIQAPTHRKLAPRNILDKIQNPYSLKRFGPEDGKDSEEVVSGSIELDDKSLAPRKEAHYNPSVFMQQEQKKNDILFKMKNRNVTNWWQQKKHDEDSDSSQSELFDQNKSLNFKSNHRPKTYISVTNESEDVTKSYTFMSAIGLGSYARVNKVRKKGDENIYVEKSINIESIVHKIPRFFGDLKQEQLEEVAVSLCYNEVEVSKAIEGHANISSIEEFFFDKAKKEFHMYSLYAKHSTLLSANHKKFISKENRGDEKLTDAQAKQLFREIVAGLAHSTLASPVHQKRIVHRDIKIDNILIFAGGNAKLTDFSVSMFVDNPDPRLLKLGTTKIYQAPEVWERQDELQFANDVWSLAVVLWVMLFDSLPFSSQNELTLKLEILEYVPVFPEQTEDCLKALLTGMFRREPACRWTVEQVASCEWLTGIE